MSAGSYVSQFSRRFSYVPLARQLPTKYKYFRQVPAVFFRSAIFIRLGVYDVQTSKKTGHTMLEVTPAMIKPPAEN
jgi:hypothetical protein